MFSPIVNTVLNCSSVTYLSTRRSYRRVGVFRRLHEHRHGADGGVRQRAAESEVRRLLHPRKQRWGRLPTPARYVRLTPLKMLTESVRNPDRSVKMYARTLVFITAACAEQIYYLLFELYMYMYVYVYPTKAVAWVTQPTSRAYRCNTTPYSAIHVALFLLGFACYPRIPDWSLK